MSRGILFIICWFSTTVAAQAGAHWSFRPRAQPPVPVFIDAVDRAWPRTSIDPFVLQRVRAAGLWDPLESTCRHASLSIL